MTLLSDMQSENSEHLERENELLRQELTEAHTLQRGLLRQLKKAQEAAAEASRAHAKMVVTLTETMRENTALTLERDMWKAQAASVKCKESDALPSIDLSALNGQITEEEINAIRKAIARLHHPDAGGDTERMKAWNSALDRYRKG